VRRTDRHPCLFIEKQGRDKIKIIGMAGKVPNTVNGETVATQWLRAEQQR
jgi:hypothetical protein